MGKKSPPANQTTTSTSRQEIDPALRSQLVSNFNIGNLLTSGMFPQVKPKTGTGSGVTSLNGANAFGPMTVGADGQYEFASVPTTGDSSGLITNPNPGDYVNPDGSAFAPPSSFTAGFDPAQIDAQNRALQFANTGIDLTQSNAIAQRQMDFNPTAMTGATVGPISSMVGGRIGQFDPMAAATVGPVGDMQAAQIRDVSPMMAAQIAQTGGVNSGTFAGTNLTPYQNAYSNQVVDPIRAYYNEQGDRAISQAIGGSRAGGAVRGSNEALISSLIRGEMAQAGGREIGGALKDQFGVTAGLVTSDLNRNLQASQANQQTNLQTNLMQAQLSQDAGRANQSAELQTALQQAQLQQGANQNNQATALQRALSNAGFAQGANQTNYGGRLQSALTQAGLDQQTGATNYEGALRTAMQNAQFGQQAGMANYEGQFRSPMIQGMGADRLQNNQLLGRNITQDNIDIMSRVGAERRGLSQARVEDPWRALAMRQGMVSGAMPAFSSQTTTGSAPSPYARSGGLSGAVGGAAAGAGLYGALTAGATPLMAASGPIGWGMLGLGALAGALG